MDNTLSMPPFSMLRWDRYCWQGSIILNSWADFRARMEIYGFETPVENRVGQYGLTVRTPESKQCPPSPEQIAAYQHTLTHEGQVHESILQAIFKEYPALQYDYDYDEEMSDLMPDIEQADELRDLITLSKVHILIQTQDDIAFVGFDFDCKWDIEHGMGVMTHKGQVLGIGGADIAQWIAT